MKPADQPTSPKENANFLSSLYFFWLIKLFRLGRKKELELNDLYRVLPEDRSSKLCDKLEEKWNDQVLKCNENSQISGEEKRPSLLRVIIQVFGFNYGMFGLIACFEECVIKIIQPLALGLLLRYFGGEFREEWYYGYIFAGIVVLSSALYTTTHHPYFFGVLHNGMQMRIACSSLIYRKALKLSQESLGKSTIGQLVNFLSNDVNRFDVSTGFFHYLWIGPIQLAITIYILWGYYGPYCLTGVSFLILFVPFQSLFGRMFGKLRLQIAIKTDRRIRLMNEILSAMRVIKMYAWEKPFSFLVKEAREEEIQKIRKTALLRTINLSLYYIASKVIIFITLLSYIFTGNFLTSEMVFVTLSLFNNVRLIMTLFFPFAISHIAEVLVSIKRIETFLLLEERDHVVERPRKESRISPLKSVGNPTVSVMNLSAAWSSKEELTLSNVSFDVKKGQLVVIIGQVGAGKGSVLQAILGELPKKSGEIHLNGKIAYTAQEPWVFGGSVRQNILFGKDMENAWYDKVLEVCELKTDLGLLPFGDSSLVGDRGTSLSGGQKARINLARAVYSNADIYLLDDPLSAVDAEVGRKLFENCIQGFLRKKAVILVTHQLQFLKSADHIILLNNGKVQAQGNYTEMLKSGINFAQLLSTSTEDANSSTVSRRASEDSFGSKGSKNDFKRCSSMSLIDSSFIGELVVSMDYDNDHEEDDRTLIKSLQDFTHKSQLLKPNIKKEYGTFNRKSTDGSLHQPQSEDEVRGRGDVSFGLYWKYIRAGSNYCSLFNLFLTNIICQFLFSSSDYWLQIWTKSEEIKVDKILSNETENFIMGNSTIDSNSTVDSFADWNTERTFQVYVYCAIIASLFFFSMFRTFEFFRICLNSSVKLHKLLFDGILRAPMRFFEVNPIGRVLNRFAKDIGIIDDTLYQVLFDTMDIGLQVIGISVIVTISNPILAIPSVCLAFVFFFIRRFYLQTARSIKRLEGISRSPVFSHLSNSLYGLTTIRAFGVEKEFEEQFDTHQDVHSSCWYLFLATGRWLGLFVDWVSVSFTALVTFSFMINIDQFDPALIGLAVSSAMTLTGLFQWGVRQSSEAENQMISVERVIEYSNLDPEAPLESSPHRKPPKEWPQQGEIRMDKVSLKYGSDPPTLKEITFVIRPSEKVGIVGRTGAGKTSLITALFRIAEISEGIIEIDGINTKKIGLHDLRSKISIIPQDPVLFIGTLRKNLDPFGEYEDLALWEVLEEIQLIESIRDLPEGLDYDITEGGGNFSVGERQLICLGRAILRKNKILVLDEATANVDQMTDAFVQKTIRTKFEECTVLTVAHRLHTVMDSDRILVLDAGRIKEFDEPFVLLSDSNSALYQLVEQTGKSSAASLLQIAKIAQEKRRQLNSQKITSVMELNENQCDFSEIDNNKNDFL